MHMSLLTKLKRGTMWKTSRKKIGFLEQRLNNLGVAKQWCVASNCLVQRENIDHSQRDSTAKYSKYQNTVDLRTT